MNDLPQLPLEEIFSHLPLEDLVRSRAVSRRWHKTIDRFKTTSLCVSECRDGFVNERSRLVNGPFAQNVIRTRKFEPFFRAFRRTIFCNLKRLRFCDFLLKMERVPAFTRLLNSFDQLEEFGFLRFTLDSSDLKIVLPLKLPMLKSVWLENLRGIWKLILVAPRLQTIKLFTCHNLRLVVVHAETPEVLITDDLERIKVRKLRNLNCLKYHYGKVASAIDPTFLFGLKQMNEIHLDDSQHVSNIFDQKRRYGLSNLKVYLCGLLLDGPDDPTINFGLNYLNDRSFVYLAENKPKLADG